MSLLLPDETFPDLLRRQLAERRRSTGDRFTTCERMLPVLGPSPPATEAEMTWPPAVETKPQTAVVTPETKPKNKGGRPRQYPVAPWKVAGMSRASWYRRQAR
jgi:hypothetical protein